jgi:four helix bundle protein
MPTFKRFEEIEAWQSARILTQQIYALTRESPWARDFGLRDQIRRSAVSIMSNIAEGYECDVSAQFVRYLSYAKGSAGEVRAQLYVALDAGYLSPDAFGQLSDLADKCGRQIYRLAAYLRSLPPRQVSEDTLDYGDNTDDADPL